MNKFLLFIAFLFILSFGYSQNKTAPNISIDNQQVFKQFEILEKERLNRVSFYLTTNPKRPVIRKNGLNSIHIYDVINGVVLYKTTHNLEASRATKTSDLQVDGSLELDLDGTGMTVGVWDFGPIDSRHREFRNKVDTGYRVTNIDNTSVNSEAGYDDHSTHVSGTIGAKGVDIKARGMATNINIDSYNWTNDKAEMIAAANAAVNPIILSNHSYGVQILTDDDKPIPAWYMGAYTEDASDMDNISRNNPKYLIVTSAGNDGKTSYTGGMYAGYDKLITDKNAKNNLVIANANPTLTSFPYDLKTLRINSSSSQGPTDDLRVKPDLAADGTNVYSTIPLGGYATFSGTSMSAPNVTGTLALLQQYYMQLHDSYMNSSTLKGLVCHNAIDDIDRPGPDPVFGWGFLDARTSAETLLAAKINTAIVDELNLAQGKTYTINFSAQSGDKLKATICWTDMPGPISKGVLNDPTPRLVNDLDLRLTKDGDTFFPWKLDYSATTGFSNSKGDYLVDNIEIVELDAPSSGVYTLTVSHKGTLKGNVGGPTDPQTQDFSLIVTGNNVVLGTKDNILSNSLAVFPNPSQGEFTISFESRSNTNDNVNVSIYDISGRLVYKNSFMNNSLQFYETIQLNNATPGIYIANISKGNSSTTHKIVIK
ncbi:S8 family serine peptidase [Gelidibacter sp.]|uniref:S8 family serine peptidase n=1 Tax=Gelidibacter sp. TaxID=2018083 RepID=UPI003266889E